MRKMTMIVAAIVMVASGLPGCKDGKGEKAPRNPLATAEETVKAYCDLDANAARLSSETWPKVLPYIAWTEEPGWDQTVVIGGFRVAAGPVTSDAGETVTVVYDVRGVLSQDYMPSRRTETVRFLVRRTASGWKITDPDFMPPHVMLKTLARHLEGTKNAELARRVLEDAGE